MTRDWLVGAAWGTIALIAVGAIMLCSREIWYGIDWLTDQCKRRWRDR